MRNRLLITSALICLLLLFFLSLPSPVDPAKYNPPIAPAQVGVLAPNNLLQKAMLLARGKLVGPEDLAIDSTGSLYTGTENGEIIRILPEGKLEVFFKTEGRIGGLQFDKNENLVVCDTQKGLFSINQVGKIKLLSTMAEGIPFGFLNAVDVSQDNIVYFTDSSSKYTAKENLYEIFESKPYGRFMSYNLNTGELKVLLKDLYFPNGVALSQHEDFVLVNETSRYRIIRYWLKGAKKGTHEIFIDNLPGFPDNISSNHRGTFWVALGAKRSKIFDTISPYPFFKKQISKLPNAFLPKPKPSGIVLAIDEKGKITQALYDLAGEYLKDISSVREYAGYLYMGSLTSDRIGKYKLP